MRLVKSFLFFLFCVGCGYCCQTSLQVCQGPVGGTVLTSNFAISWAPYGWSLVSCQNDYVSGSTQHYLIEIVNLTGSDSEKCACLHSITPSYSVDFRDSQESGAAHVNGCNIHSGQDTAGFGDSLGFATCTELGKQDPGNPGPGGVVTNGVWVVISGVKNGRDTSYAPVVSAGGCKNVVITNAGVNHTPVLGNSHDSSYVVDGVTIHVCVSGGVALSGTCKSNGLDSGSAPPVPNGSGVVPPPGSDSLNHHVMSDTSGAGLTGKEYGVGVNTIVSAIDSNFSITNGYLKSINNATIANSVQGTVKPPASSSPYVSDTTGSGVVFDSSGLGLTKGNLQSMDTMGSGLFTGKLDSAGEGSRLHSKIDSIGNGLAGDTNITGPDSARIGDFFSPFAVDWGDTSSCDCDSTMFQFTFGGKNLPVNLCAFNIAQYTGPVFTLFAVFAVFLFYRNCLFRLLLKMDQFLP